MTDLERTLHELAAATRYPPTPDIASRVVSAALVRHRRRLVAIALAIVVVALGVAFAVPPAHSAILDWLGFGPVQVQRVEKLPSPNTRTLSLGRAVSLAAARRETNFRILLPHGRPDGVFIRPEIGRASCRERV